MPSISAFMVQGLLALSGFFNDAGGPIDGIDRTALTLNNDFDAGGAMIPNTEAIEAIGPVIALDYGMFQGKNSDNGLVSMFFGIPFAAPAQRFKLPQKPKVLKGMQNATVLGAACPQQKHAIDLPIPKPASVSEDCLSINIIKPSFTTPFSRLPVLVIIHSGGFEIGSNEEGSSRANVLVERSIAAATPVIVVSANYRLSGFGFLAGKEAQAAGISNLGLRDQIFALEWVQKYITAFGGDPRRVVITGASAGGISTGLLTLENNRFQPNTLFRGAVMLSGSVLTTSTVADGQPEYDFLVEKTNCGSARDTLECLRQVPYQQLMDVVDLTANVFSYSSLQTVWRARIDGEVVMRDPLVSIAEGRRHKIPVMIGTNDDEGTLFTLPLLNITKDEHFETYIHRNYLPDASPEQLAQLAKHYPKDPTRGSPFDTGIKSAITPQFKRLAAFQGDHSFIGGRRFYLQGVRGRPADSKMWSWVNRRGKWLPILGSMHTGDFGLWFPTEQEATATEVFGTNAMINFINNLDPNRSMSFKTILPFNWPTWHTPNPLSPTRAPSLLLTTDEKFSKVRVGAEDFRVAEIQYLFDVMVDIAKKKEANAYGWK
ncbi:carotenoid ester lipase precursor [Roridomyces roridus]|uniref:Carboxylic ester hydrolase n=1 Tax=Roridomyces roridus TaxID=1738132 RepID=A0AAD7BCU9_9AGAR|nr:carotenoid ester lipase precursor [Roridomyces roridus]